MSHLKERKEKNCLNCQAQVQGRYCHICGQENVVTYESAWQLAVHFVQDILHYDGKFFRTIRYLLTKPGLLTREYAIGRRVSYVNPLRLYIFSSAIFFIIFFAVSDRKETIVTNTYNGKTEAEIAVMDSLAFDQFTRGLNKGQPMTRAEFGDYLDSATKYGGIVLMSSSYKSKEEFDSLLRTGAIKHNWLERQVLYKEIEVNQKYHRDRKQIMQRFRQEFLHSFPQMLFLSLPLFALILKLLYIRHKRFYYANHAIFGIHFYVFIFLMILLSIGLNRLIGLFGADATDLLVFINLILILFYEYKSMRVVYDQGRSKTIFKFILLNLAHLIVMIFLMFGFILFSAFKL